jgi:hypothetical protein
MGASSSYLFQKLDLRKVEIIQVIITFNNFRKSLIFLKKTAITFVMQLIIRMKYNLACFLIPPSLELPQNTEGTAKTKRAGLHKGVCDNKERFIDLSTHKCTHVYIHMLDNFGGGVARPFSTIPMYL